MFAMQLAPDLPPTQDYNDDDDDDDIYIMMKCLSVCVSRFCLFCLPPAKASAGWSAPTLYFSIVRARVVFLHTFDYKT